MAETDASQENSGQESQSGGRVFREEADGSASLVLHTSEPIKTLADLLRVAQVDESVWYVDSWEVSDWTVPMNVKRGQRVVPLRRPNGGEKDTAIWNPSEPIVTQMYRVRARLKRIVPRAIRQAVDAIYERMKKHAPRYPRPERERPVPGEPFLAVFGLFDAHFGKLCWAPETDSNYDLKLAEQIYRNAVEDLLTESRHRPLGLSVLPIGNDFFHVDNRKNTTYRGTPQDVDGRYAKVFEAGVMAVVWAVEMLAAVAPVRVVWVPGNHDPTVSYHLAREVKAWFRHARRVEVDDGPRSRKYLTWGTNLVGLTHGDVPTRSEDLPSLMAVEASSEWSAATCREWLIGHQHRSRQWVTKSVDSHHGTVVRVLRALTGTDAWHYENGFVGTQQAAEIYWYGRDRGYAGHSVVPVRN